MPKKKTKKVGYDRVATEVSPECWEWATGTFRWRYVCRPGLNLTVIYGDSEQTCLFSPDLKEAAVVAEGFELGWGARERAE